MSGRKQEIVTVPAWEGNRDAGKRYQITEMNAVDAEKWAWRVFIALKGSGSEIPESAQHLGMVGIAFAGMNAFMRADVDPDALEPLLDQMMTCVKIVRDPKHPDFATDLVSPDDIEEVRTRVWLRSEVLRIHTNFSLADAVSSWMSTAAIQPGS